MDKEKKLYKSRDDKMLDGVCGGIAEYLGVDSTIIRLAWAFLAMFGGTGIVFYIACAIIMQFEPLDKDKVKEKDTSENKETEKEEESIFEERE